MGFRSRMKDIWRNEGLPGFARYAHMQIAWLRIALSRAARCSVVKSNYGPRFHANYDDVTFNLYIIAEYGFTFWRRLGAIDYPFIFLDIGANQGLYAIGAARNPHLRMAYAFEPVSSTADLLDKNIRLNGVDDRCVVVRKAISDTPGPVAMAMAQNHSGRATIAAKNQHLDHPAEMEMAEMIDAGDLQEILSEKDLPIIVKIDVEGHEAVVIRELFKMAQSANIAELCFEVDERWTDAAAIVAFLKDRGFSHMAKIGTGSHYDMLAKRVPSGL